MRTRARAALCLAAVAATAALAAGCGGGDDGGETSAATQTAAATAAALTADEYREQADGICARYDELSDQTPEPASEADVGAYLETVLGQNREQYAELTALQPPPELAELHAQAMTLLRQQLEATEDALGRITDGEGPAVVVADAGPTIEALGDQASAIAKELGLSVCGAEDEPAGTAPGGATTP